MTSAAVAGESTSTRSTSASRIVAVERRIYRHSADELDADGRLAIPPFVDRHFHLDAGLTAGTPPRNRSGTLLEGISL